MPRVISQDDVESGLDGLGIFNIILVILLIGAAFAIVVLMRRDNSDDSIFYDDDDDEWEEDEEDVTVQNVTPILPPLAPERPDLDAASRSLDIVEPEQKEVEVEPEPAVAEDPWADVDHSTHDAEEPISEEMVAEDVIPEEVVVEEMPADDEISEVTEDESDDDNIDFSSMTVAQLKDELRARGLPLKGKKAELIARLEE
jgi:hypothetical protein